MDWLGDFPEISEAVVHMSFVKRCFSVKFGKFLRIPIFIEHPWKFQMQLFTSVLENISFEKFLSLQRNICDEVHFS